MLDRALRHLGWADNRFFTKLAELPPQALLATYAPGTWPVGQQAVHIVSGAEWYCYCLAGEQWTELAAPTESAGVLALRDHLRGRDRILLAQAQLPDERMTFEDEDGPRSALRSTLLVQAIVHAAEHRTQIACALAAHGYIGPDLDSLDLWAFEAFEASEASEDSAG